MKKVFIGGIVILAIFLIVLSFIPLGIEPLTEVYFENHTKLPAYLFLNKDYNYSFTVHNLEYQQVNYNYTIDAYSESGNFLYNMDKGDFILLHNETETIDENFVMKEHFDRTKVVVLVEKDLSAETPDFKKKLWWPDPNYPTQIDIHFWMEEIRGPTVIVGKG